MNNINVLIDKSDQESIVAKRKKITNEGLREESFVEDNLSDLAKEVLLNIKHQHLFVN